MDQFFGQTWVQVLLTIIGIVAVSTVAMRWGYRNGHALGVRVGRWIPGDKVEQWLVEFLRGLKEGLESTYTETTVETTTAWKSMDGMELKVDVLKVLNNPTGGRASGRS